MPTRDTAWPDGTPCWVDYGATDLDAARAFYRSVLGWDYTGGEAAYGGYLTCLASGRPAAGMAPAMSPDQPPLWMTYFAASDAAATARRITDAGGALVVAPMQVGPLGTMVVATDPQGSVFGLWQADDHTGVQIYNEPGALVWNEAAVGDPQAARAFYGEVFGFRFDDVPEAPGYATFRTGDHPLGGLGGLSAPGAPRGWATCFSVASADQAVDAAVAGGGSVLTPAQDAPYGRFAVLRDPWGAPFSVMQQPPS